MFSPAVGEFGSNSLSGAGSGLQLIVMIKNIIRSTVPLGLLIFAFNTCMFAEIPLTPGEKPSFVKLLCTTDGDHKTIEGSVAAVAAAVRR